MNFLHLIDHLGQRVGSHQIPVNPNARYLQGLLESSALHYELMTRIITAVYTHNNCKHLTDPVNQEATFEALSPIRLEVLRSPRTDVDVINLMDDLCGAIALAFAKENTDDEATKRQATAGQAVHTHNAGQLIPLKPTPRRSF